MRPSPTETAVTLAQTMVEYGALNSIAAGFAAAQQKLETYIGSGNTKYALIIVLAVVFLLLVKRRR